MSWALLAELSHPLEAAALCARLEQEGIAVRLENEGVQWMIPVPGAFAARIFVAEQDAVHAFRIWRAWQRETLACDRNFGE